MKKILILAASVVGAVGAYAQGTITFADNDNSTGGALQVQIYSPDTINPSVETMGNSAADTPAGATAYTGTPLGGSATGAGPTGYANGNNFTAELYGAAGSGLTFGELSPLNQYSSTFYTAAAASGLFKTVLPSSDPGIPGTGTASTATATLSLAVWYNGNNTITSLQSAEAAGVPYGWSTPFTLGGLGGTGQPPATSPVLTGLTSFSLITPTITPEPGTITLALMGAAGFLMRRRSK
jgi:hypothetical protein